MQSAGTEEFTPGFFDQASIAWKENKVSIGGGAYRYKRREKEKTMKVAFTDIRRSLRIASRATRLEKSK